MSDYASSCAPLALPQNQKDEDEFSDGEDSDEGTGAGDDWEEIDGAETSGAAPEKKGTLLYDFAGMREGVLVKGRHR